MGLENKLKKSELFVLCDCGNAEHQAILTARVEDDPAWSDVSLECHLTTWKNPLRRIWVAIKYVFGYRSRYGEWDDLLLSPGEARRVGDFLIKFANDVAVLSQKSLLNAANIDIEKATKLAAVAKQKKCQFIQNLSPEKE